ncbi:hypothetical protein N3K66_001962 [Trichothecium roseum]|uniref:Uncharacterized protein n=1 Tax=Trichothecium roseum TaxID=47278 RepID=A0ACC0V9V6_9HYPO|nr:hypothetical protein N3K66_001962 [Trichothecium roseum]
MHPASLLAVASLAAASPLETRQQTNTPCHNVHVITVRGSYEGYAAGSNRQDDLLVPEVCKGKPSCGYEDVVYPATLDGDYCGSSQTQGVWALIGQLNDYAGRCPDSKIVLVGYSQGAHVIGDVLGTGGSGSCDAGNQALDPKSSPGNKIEAIAFFGDPRRTPGQSYNNGSAGKDSTGDFPRLGDDITQLNHYEGRLGSWCLANDLYCTTGSDGNAHATAVETYYKDAAEFIRGKL